MLAREERVVGDPDAVQAGRVRLRDDRVHAGHREGGAHVDARDPPRGDVGAGERAVEHARLGAVDGVARAAAQLVLGVAAREIAPDLLPVHRGSSPAARAASTICS